MKKLATKEMIIGGCVILALAILFFGIEYLKGVSLFKPSNYYYAVYSDVKGLTTSSPVNVNGVKIGQVDNVSIMYDRQGSVLVQFSIDKNYRLTKGSQALLDSDLLGTASLTLNVVPGTSYYHSGDTVKSAIASGMMDQISGNLLPGIGNMVPKIDSLLVNLNDITGNPAVVKSLENLEAVTSSLRTTVNLLNASASKMPPVMDEVTGIVDNVNRISADLACLSNSLANAPVDSTLNNINRISADLASLTDKLNNPDSNIGLLLNDTQLYDNLTRATADIDSLLVDIKKNPKRYISIKLL